jgi:phosphatidate cytidylyltransferase
MNNFWQRTLSGALYVVLVTGSVTLGPKYFIPFFALVTAVCLGEFYRQSIDGSRSLRTIAVMAGTLLFVISGFAMQGEAALLKYLPVLAVMPYMLLLWGLFQPHQEHFRNMGMLLLGIVYIVFPFILLSSLEARLGNGYGLSPLLGIFILFWTNDTGAYLSGKAFGKNLLFPRISPGKTIEGLAGGIVLCMLAAWLLSAYSYGMDLAGWLAAGAIISVFGTFGDLVESLWKRQAGIKDSGNIMPGHGGLMDRFDGFFIAVPVLYFYLFFIDK